MDGWSLFGRTNLWLYAIILNICSAFLASAADTKAPQQLHGEVSGITVHVPIPVTALAELYAGIHKDHVHRTEGREWIALGGGTGFLKYKLWPGEQGYTATGDLMLSQATFPFGVEYAKQINGSVTKIAECGQQDPATGTGRLSVSLTTTFAQGRSYGLLPTSTVTDVKPKRPCLLSEQGVDAAPLMAQIYRGHLQRKLSAVDRKATSLMALKPAVGRIWRDLEEPLLLDEEQAIWLVVNPESIGTAGIESLSGTPAAGFGVTARPVVVRGAQPVPKHLALPELQGRFTDDGFHVSFAMEVPMEEANQRLREAVVGQEWSLGVGTIKIAGATLYSLGDQIEVELTLRGLLPLTLRLKGTPAYENSTGRIVFRNFDYTIKERTAATDMAEEWLHEPLRDELARRLSVPVQDELDLMRMTLEKGMNRDMRGGRLRGTVRHLVLEELGVQAQTLSARFKTDGVLHYDVRADAVTP